MAGWLSTRDLIDVVLAAAALEVVLLTLYRWRTGKGPRMKRIAANLAAGLCLMLALHGVARGAAPAAVAAWLLGAGIAHAIDLWSRWER